VNYDVLLAVYCIGSAISMALFCAEAIYDVKSVAGYYIAFFPFVPFAIWALAMKALKITREMSGPAGLHGVSKEDRDRDLYTKKDQ